MRRESSPMPSTVRTSAPSTRKSGVMHALAETNLRVLATWNASCEMCMKFEIPRFLFLFVPSCNRHSTRTASALFTGQLRSGQIHWKLHQYSAFFQQNLSDRESCCAKYLQKLTFVPEKSSESELGIGIVNAHFVAIDVESYCRVHHLIGSLRCYNAQKKSLQYTKGHEKSWEKSWNYYCSKSLEPNTGKEERVRFSNGHWLCSAGIVIVFQVSKHDNTAKTRDAKKCASYHDSW